MTNEKVKFFVIGFHGYFDSREAAESYAILKRVSRSRVCEYLPARMTALLFDASSFSEIEVANLAAKNKQD